MHISTIRMMAGGAVAATALCALPIASPLPIGSPAPLAAQEAAPRKPLSKARMKALAQEAVADVESRSRFTQQMIDQIFSYGELGFQEVETSRYLVDLLRHNGFTVEEGVAGIPTAWVATWGSG